jgi:hypothetical protein
VGTCGRPSYKALRYIARPSDLPLLERAALTFESLPPSSADIVASLRAAALVTMNEVDPRLAALYCVRLISDRHTSRMSGEPALTAAQLLAAQGHWLPLFQYAMHEPEPVAEVVLACLRQLANQPRMVVYSLLERYGQSADDVLLVGVLDLVLAQEEEEEALTEFLVEFMRTTRRFEVYHYLVTVIAASRRRDRIEALLKVAASEQQVRKVRSLLDALALLEREPGVPALMERLQRRIG